MIATKIKIVLGVILTLIAVVILAPPPPVRQKANREPVCFWHMWASEGQPVVDMPGHDHTAVGDSWYPMTLISYGTGTPRALNSSMSRVATKTLAVAMAVGRGERARML